MTESAHLVAKALGELLIGPGVGLTTPPLALDVIKIDHRFIRDIPYNVSATDVASAVIALAHKLHLTVVAEGVETLQQLTFLKSAGCAQCQGNLFSYPLDEDALIGFLIRQYEKPLIS